MSKKKKKKKFWGGLFPTQKKSVYYLSEAVNALKRNNLTAALQHATQVLHQTERIAEREQAQQIIGEVQFRNAVAISDPNRKLAHIQAGLAMTPYDPRLHFYEGVILLQTGQAAKSLKAFDQTTAIDPHREGLAYFRQLAALSAKKPIKDGQNLSPAEANTLALIRQFQKKSSTKTKNAETVPESAVIGNPQLWEALLNMHLDKKAAPNKELQQGAPMPLPKTAALILQYYQGVAAMRQEQPQAALDFWQGAFSKGFATTWVQKNLGVASQEQFQGLIEQQRWQEIINHFRKSNLKIEHDSFNQILSLAYFHIGYEQAQKGNWKQAITHWQEAAQKAHNRYLAQNLAIAYEHLGDWTYAARAWEDMLRRKPKKPDHPDYLADKQTAAIWDHVADCYIQTRMDFRAFECFQKAIQVNPDNIERRFKFVRFVLDMGYNLSIAIDELQAILKIVPDHLEALLQLAHIISEEQGRDASELWKKILTLEPDHKEARNGLATEYVEKVMAIAEQRRPSKKKKAALTPYQQQLAILSEGLELLPEHPDLLVALGVAHMKVGKQSEACAEFWRAYQHAPQNLDVIAALLFNLSQLNEAEMLDTIITETRRIPTLLPGFWVEQGKKVLAHPAWAKRFFDEALTQPRVKAEDTLASVLVDICMAIPPEPRYRTLRNDYVRRVEQEVPNSGAIEYLEAFAAFSLRGDFSKARRLLHQAKKRAKAAGEKILLQNIEAAEGMVSMSPDKFMNKMLGGMNKGMNKGMIGDLLDEIESMDPRLMEQMLDEMERLFGKHGRF